MLDLFEEDPLIEREVLSDETCGNHEEQTAQVISERIVKQMVAHGARPAAPPGRCARHAGAVIEGGGAVLAAENIAALEVVGVLVAEHRDQIPGLTALD